MFCNFRIVAHETFADHIIVCFAAFLPMGW